MSSRLRVVQVADVAHVAEAIAGALEPHADVVNVPMRQSGATRRGLLKALAAPLRLADAVAAARAARGHDPDVVHVHWVPNGVVGPLTGRPWVLHAHGSDLRALDPPRRAAFAPILRLATAIVVSTPDLLEHAPRGAAFLPTPIPALDISADERWDVLVASVASPVKGSAVAFETLRLLARARPELRLAAHDGPTFESGPWERLPPTPKQRFHERLAAARIVLGQFGVGALGVADLEAMALGRPLLTWVRDGLYDDPPPVVSSRDPAELAERALHLLDVDGGRAALGADAAAWVGRMHDPGRVAEQLLALYRRIGAGPTP